MSQTLHNRPSGTMTGGRALAEMLHLSGAGPMFGMGGFQLLPFYDAAGLHGFFKREARKGNMKLTSDRPAMWRTTSKP